MMEFMEDGATARGRSRRAQLGSAREVEGSAQNISVTSFHESQKLLFNRSICDWEMGHSVRSTTGDELQSQDACTARQAQLSCARDGGGFCAKRLR